MLKQVVLVSCVAGKKAGLNRAADLYTSAWFIKARRLVERTGAPWLRAGWWSAPVRPGSFFQQNTGCLVPKQWSGPITKH